MDSINAGNLFNMSGMSLIGGWADPSQEKVADEVTPVNTLVRWYESPLLFILTITALLLVVGFVQRKVG